MKLLPSKNPTPILAYRSNFPSPNSGRGLRGGVKFYAASQRIGISLDESAILS
jgi:hypothetical protein